MYKGKKFLALIPARGGSKGLPGKNIKILGDKPLIAWSIEAAKKSQYIDRLVVSTDSQEIAKVSQNFGAEVPFQRPADIASDSAKMTDVMLHAMSFVENKSGQYDYLVLLQPTSPFRNENHIDEAIELLFQKNAKVILGVLKLEHSPQLCGILPPDGNLENFYDKSLQNLNRQDMGKYYRLNGAIYIVAWDYWIKHQSWLGKDSYAYIMDKKYSVDIDTLEDFLYAETLLRHSLLNVS